MRAMLVFTTTNNATQKLLQTNVANKQRQQTNKQAAIPPYKKHACKAHPNYKQTNKLTNNQTSKKLCILPVCHSTKQSICLHRLSLQKTNKSLQTNATNKQRQQSAQQTKTQIEY